MSNGPGAGVLSEPIEGPPIGDGGTIPPPVITLPPEPPGGGQFLAIKIQAAPAVIVIPESDDSVVAIPAMNIVTVE